MISVNESRKASVIITDPLCKRYALIIQLNLYRAAYKTTISLHFPHGTIFAIAKFIILSLRGWFPYIPTS